MRERTLLVEEGSPRHAALLELGWVQRETRTTDDPGLRYVLMVKEEKGNG